MISLCITTYNRTELLFESFAQVLHDPRISEIVIVDDCSDESIFKNMSWRVYQLGSDKIHIYRNNKNLGCYRNKREAISRASNEWVILLDSDNVISPKYVDAIFEYNPAYEDGSYSNSWYTKAVYQPIFARPHFDFTKFQNISVSHENVSVYANDPTFTTALNAMNYFVNRDEYLHVWEDRPEPWTADSLLQNYNWLKAGNSIYFCPGLEYEHRVHEGSHYKEHHRKTGNLYNELVQKLKEMR